MRRWARVGALGLLALLEGAMGHMNSEVNLVRSRRLQEGNGTESINAKWQCAADEVSHLEAASETKRHWVVHAVVRLRVCPRAWRS